MGKFYTVIEDNLYLSIRSILDILGYPEVLVVHSNVNSLEPSKTYCVIDILDTSQSGRTNEASYIASETPDGVDMLESMTHYILLTQISFIGTNAGDVSHDFRHNISNNRVCFEEIQKKSFGLLSKSNLRRNPQKRETQWVNSFNMDMSLSFAIRTRQSYDWVEYITINDEVIRIWNDE